MSLKLIFPRILRLENKVRKKREIQIFLSKSTKKTLLDLWARTERIYDIIIIWPLLKAERLRRLMVFIRPFDYRM